MGDRYITNVAHTLIGQLGITWEDAHDSSWVGDKFHAQHLYERKQQLVRQKIEQMRPETLGRLAVQGKAHGDGSTPKTSLYSVHCGSYLGKYRSGRELLVELATTALIAEMTDLLRVRMERELRTN